MGTVSSSAVTSWWLGRPRGPHEQSRELLLGCLFPLEGKRGHARGSQGTRNKLLFFVCCFLSGRSHHKWGLWNPHWFPRSGFGSRGRFLSQVSLINSPQGTAGMRLSHVTWPCPSSLGPSSVERNPMILVIQCPVGGAASSKS